MLFLAITICATPLAAAQQEEPTLMELYQANKPTPEGKTPTPEQQKPTAPLQGELTDQEITAAVEQVYASVPDLNFFNIQVHTVNGEVFLKATVRYYRQYQRAIEYAEGVPGVKKVNAQQLYYFEKP